MISPMSKKPDIILVLVDDMGFADPGITGSEINTPNIDALANNGVLLTSMYNCTRCCPTRASLLTGLDWQLLLPKLLKAWGCGDGRWLNHSWQF
jgi:arylsulfatase A-like enzyme